MSDVLKRDLAIEFRSDGTADLVELAGDLASRSGLDNLSQALSLRLLSERGELTELGHPRFGSRVRELIGQPLDRANLGLLLRFVRAALVRDPRVESVVSVREIEELRGPERLYIEATVLAVDGSEQRVTAPLELG